MNKLLSVVGGGLLLSAWVAQAQVPVEKGDEAKWYFSPGIGVLHVEGDQAFEPGPQLAARIGYDQFEKLWSWEGSLLICPKMDANYYNDYSTGTPVPTTKLGKDSISVTTLAFEGIYHFTRWDRVDPFLALGGALQFYSDEVNDKTVDPSVRYGVGIMYHFNDEWGLRADGRWHWTGSKNAEANSSIDVGMIWHWGAGVPPKFTATGGPLDSDADGLPDADERRIGTDPFDPDTDKDGLNDGDEVLVWKTDPLNPDTDWDGLKDGEEVHKYKTDPRLRDTDKGGVADGHEVIEDNTNPLDPKDDLKLYELYIQFEYDKADIKTEYFAQIDVIAKVLRRNPDATARVEGHADQTKKSSNEYNMALSERRAKSIVNYLSTVGGIDKKRLTAVGYGYTRPKEKPDLVNGNPNNRRVEIYIRGAQDENEKNAPAAPATN